MELTHRKFKRNEPFECLPNDVQPGYFVQYRAPIPSYVPYLHSVRGEHTRVLILATKWKKGAIAGKKPAGTAYLTRAYHDKNTGKLGRHFDSDSAYYFKDSEGQGWIVKASDDDQLISAVSLGTSMPQLNQAFPLPEAALGRIDALFS
jgi:hypothetical protein